MPVVNPGIRRLLASAIQRLFNGASFYAPLTHSLVLERGTGTPTFTRATTATVTDNEGVQRTAISGEARFTGARRVRNFSLGKTEDLTAAGGWGLSNITTPGSATVTAPDGTTTGWVLTATANSAQWYRQCTGMTPNGSGLEHIWLRRNTGSGAVQMFTGAGAAAGNLNITSTWTQYSLPVTIAAGGTAYLGIQINVSGDKVEVWHPQLEDITGRADQTTPSEYVSVGVPADWHGTELVTNGTFDTDTTGWSTNGTTLAISSGQMLITNTGSFGKAYQTLSTTIGTKYTVSADYTLGTATRCVIGLGNTLVDAGNEVLGGNTQTAASGRCSLEFTATATTTYFVIGLDAGAATTLLVDNISVKPAIYHGAGVDGVKYFDTDINGAAIPSTTLLGYQAEGARTNLCLQSNAFTTTWTNTLDVISQNATGVDGATSAWTLTDSSGAALRTLVQSITFTAAVYTVSCLVKKTSGATVFPILYVTTGGATYGISTIDTNNGVATAWTSSGYGANPATLSAACASYNSNFWLASLTFTATAAAWSVTFAPAATTNATQSSGTAATALTGSQVVTSFQVELGAFPSSRIATTTIAVARNKDEESVSTSGNIAAAAGSIYLEYTPTHAPSGTVAFWGTYVDADNYTAILHDATNLIFRKRIAGVNYDATIANAFVSGTTYKACATWGSAGTSITLNGTEGTPHANTTAAQIAATMQWGADGNSLQQPFASIRNCRDWLRQLSASERSAVTS